MVLGQIRITAERPAPESLADFRQAQQQARNDDQHGGLVEKNTEKDVIKHDGEIGVERWPELTLCGRFANRILASAWPECGSLSFP